MTSEALDHLVESQSYGAQLGGTEDAEEVAKYSMSEDAADAGTDSMSIDGGVGQPRVGNSLLGNLGTFEVVLDIPSVSQGPREGPLNVVGLILQTVELGL